MKVEVAVPNKPTVSVDVKQHFNNNLTTSVGKAMGVNKETTNTAQFFNMPANLLDCYTLTNRFTYSNEEAAEQLSHCKYQWQ